MSRNYYLEEYTLKRVYLENVEDKKDIFDNVTDIEIRTYNNKYTVIIFNMKSEDSHIKNYYFIEKEIFNEIIDLGYHYITLEHCEDNLQDIQVSVYRLLQFLIKDCNLQEFGELENYEYLEKEEKGDALDFLND